MPISDNLAPDAIAPYAGQVTKDTTGSTFIETATLNPASNDAEFGLFVVYSTGSERKLVEVPSSGAFLQRDLAGVVHRPKGSIASRNGVPAAFRAEDSPDVSFVSRAIEIVVQTNTAVNEGDDVFVVNTGADAGKARNDATNATALFGVNFTETTTGPGTAKISDTPIVIP